MEDPETEVNPEEEPEEATEEQADDEAGETDTDTEQVVVDVAPTAPAVEIPAAPEAAAPAAKPAEMKIVITFSGDNVLFGVGMPDCDPVLTCITGGLSAVVPRIEALVEEAKAKWAKEKLNPKANLPEPAPLPARTPAPTRKTTSKKSEESTGTPKFF